MNISDFQILTVESLPGCTSYTERWNTAVERLKENVEEASELVEKMHGAAGSKEYSEERREVRKLIGFMLVDLTQMAVAMGWVLEDIAMQNVIDLIRQKKEDAQMTGGMGAGGKVLKLAREIVAEIERGADSE